jgi:hypothetical protein
MYGTLHTTPTGFEIVTTDTQWSEPLLVTTHYRVTAINDPYRRADDGAAVTYRIGGPWSGAGFQCSTDPEPFKVDRDAIKPPRPRKGMVWVWRDGEWKSVLPGIARLYSESIL